MYSQYRCVSLIKLQQQMCLWCCILFCSVCAETPPKLPGDDITGIYMPGISISDTSAPDSAAVCLSTPQWRGQTMKTWEAPSLLEQIEEDAVVLPIGTGAVYIPRLADAKQEPDIQIFDTGGKLSASGTTGRKYPLEPGSYSVVLGSGSDNQRITRKITISEGAAEPLIPDWCALTVDIVDSNTIPFRGQYELARIDEFEAFGRSYGRDQALGEQLKTWILSPGLYKIFTVGAGYNSLNNFITVRLLPGEMVRLTVIEDPSTYKIMSGGIINANAVSAQLNSNWKYRLNLGGTLLFNANVDHTDKTNTKNSSTIALLSLFDLIYKKKPTDWETNVYIKEGMNISDVHVNDIDLTTDEFRLTSLAVWRIFFPWLGPYCRAEIQTHLLPVSSQFSSSSSNHYFVMLARDSTIRQIDSVNKAHVTQPSLSPITAEIGIGTNIDAVTTHAFDAQLRIGIGYSLLRRWGEKSVQDSSYIKVTPTTDTAVLNDVLSRNYVVLQDAAVVTSQSYGPEMGTTFNIRTGGWGLVRGDWRVRIPIDPLIKKEGIRPDYDAITTISWLLTRTLTLDYTYQYVLKQPVKTSARYEVATQSVFLRFSFSSR